MFDYWKQSTGIMWARVRIHMHTHTQPWNNAPYMSFIHIVNYQWHKHEHVWGKSLLSHSAVFLFDAVHPFHFWAQFSFSSHLTFSSSCEIAQICLISCREVLDHTHTLSHTHQHSFRIKIINLLHNEITFNRVLFSLELLFLFHSDSRVRRVLWAPTCNSFAPCTQFWLNFAKKNLECQKFDDSIANYICDYLPTHWCPWIEENPLIHSISTFYIKRTISSPLNTNTHMHFNKSKWLKKDGRKWMIL